MLSPESSPYGGCENSGDRSANPDDLWRWQGLGKIAARLFDLLADSTGPTEALVERCNVKVRTVKHHLARMARLGLVQYLGAERWWRVGYALDLELTAVALHVDGTGVRQRKRHAAERVAYHAKRDGLVSEGRTRGAPIHAEDLPAITKPQAGSEATAE